jgi:arginyl-tRNA--protein-N-Asp/Glu arginylyltransferase
MESLFSFVAPPSRCSYLPREIWSLEYEQFLAITPAEYVQRLGEGWRRFGSTLFRPRCSSCNACRSLRVLVDKFEPDRSQRRNRNRNAREIQLRIGPPKVAREKLDLYDRYHAFQAEHKGWPEHPAKDEPSYVESFVDNPFSTKEYCYYFEGRLVGVGYVDDLPGAMSAIYFFYEPQERHRGLGSWHILSLLDQAAARSIPHVYLGYYVADCPSMAYKSRFRPHELLSAAGAWHKSDT